MSQQVETVVFDVGRVIVRWNLRYLFEKLIEDQDELEWFCSNVVSEEWHFQHDAGRALDEMVSERKQEFPAYGQFIDAYATRFLETIPGRMPGTADIIESLAAKGTPLFAITNFGDELWQEFFPTEPLLDNFRDIVVSGVEKIAKPDPAIFELAAKRFSIDPGRSLFIDDSRPNVDSAAALGWQVHHFTGAARLKLDLKARGLI